MENLSKIVLLFILLAGCLSGQQIQVGATTATARGVMGERDKGKEDEVATLFEKTRSGLKASHMSRIEDRDILEEQICTVALSGMPSSIHRDSATFAIYKTSQPDVLSPELNRVASFDVLHPKSRVSTVDTQWPFGE